MLLAILNPNKEIDMYWKRQGEKSKKSAGELSPTNKSEGRIREYPRPDEASFKSYWEGGEGQPNFEEAISSEIIEECNSSDCWRRDTRRIINSLSFRRLQYKTQVFLRPQRDHYSDRMRHTLSVANVAERIARGHKLNADLTRAIALAHDIGHPPYGHAGEQAIDFQIREYSKGTYFHHALQGARMLIYLEYDSRFALPIHERKEEAYGIGPTIEVINGILNHSDSYIDAIRRGKKVDRWKQLEKIVGKPGEKTTPEAECVAVSDEISQCVNDLADAYQSHLISRNDLDSLYKQESKCHSKFGEELEDYLIKRVIVINGHLKLDENGEELMKGYNDLIGPKVYESLDVLLSDNRAWHIISDLFEYFMGEEKVIEDIRIRKIKSDHRIHRNIYELGWLYGLEWPRIIANYLSGMTDRYADYLHEKLGLPSRRDPKGLPYPFRKS